MAQQQKILLYVLPLIFAFSGVNFPIGVLIYWTTTNLWSMGQQFYTIRRMPAPGSQAEIAMKERKAKKAAAKGVIEDVADAADRGEAPRSARAAEAQGPREAPPDQPAATQTPSRESKRIPARRTAAVTKPPTKPKK